MDIGDYSERLASISRIVEVLGDRLTIDGRVCPPPDSATGLDGSPVPSQALINELAHLVERLQHDFNNGRRALRPAGTGRRLIADTATAARPATTTTRSLAYGPGEARGSVMSHASGRHGVHFSHSHEHAVAAVVDMVREAIDHGRAVVLVATGVHRRWIESALQQQGVQLEGDSVHFLDAETTLSSLLVDGKPDRDRFRSVIGSILADVVARAPAGVSVYGEMVGLLWERGDAVSAMHLEEFWNELQRALPFSLTCGYLLDRRTTSSDLESIRRLHSHVT